MGVCTCVCVVCAWLCVCVSVAWAWCARVCVLRGRGACTWVGGVGRAWALCVRGRVTWAMRGRAAWAVRGRCVRVGEWRGPCVGVWPSDVGHVACAVWCGVAWAVLCRGMGRVRGGWRGPWAGAGEWLWLAWAVSVFMYMSVKYGRLGSRGCMVDGDVEVDEEVPSIRVGARCGRWRRRSSVATAHVGRGGEVECFVTIG